MICAYLTNVCRHLWFYLVDSGGIVIFAVLNRLSGSVVLFLWRAMIVATYGKACDCYVKSITMFFPYVTFL